MELVVVMAFYALMVVAVIQVSTLVKTHMKMCTKKGELYSM